MTRHRDQIPIICAGRFYSDLIFTGVPKLPSLGIEVFAEGFGIRPGGGAYITAANFRELGHPSMLASMLPGEPFAGAVRTEMVNVGVDLGFCQQLDNTLGPQITVAIAHNGERAFLSRRCGPALPNLSADSLVASGAVHLHIGELATLIERPELIAIARETGLSISLDCSWDETIGASDIDPLISQVDVFLPNEREADRLGRFGFDQPLAPLTVVKQGARGARAITENGVIEAETDAISAVDSTGAGDAFNAGFLSAWLTGAPLPDCLSSGNAQAAVELLKRGGAVCEREGKENTSLKSLQKGFG